MRVFLVGRPNVGKSSLYNRLTKGQAKVGNFPGVTVDVLTARVRVGAREVEFVDLPGLYVVDGAAAAGTDEHLAQTFLAGASSDDCVLFVADATDLRGSLLLLQQLRATWPHLRVVVGVTQHDLLTKAGACVDAGKLAQALALPVVVTSAFSPTCEAEVFAALEQVPETVATPQMFEPTAVAASVTQNLTDGRVLRARTERIDRVLLHPVVGPLSFVVVMATLFATAFLMAEPISALLGAALENLGVLVRSALGATALASLVVDGVFKGAGTVLSFLPQVLFVIAALDLLEQSGYFARTAFLVDRLLRLFGLSGKAFVPLLTGHACAVPAIAATRVLRDPNERLRTLLIVPLMACSARLPVYALVVSAFFGQHVWTKVGVFVGLYFAGLMAGLLASFAMRKSIAKSRALPLLVELPKYRIPSVRALLSRLSIEAREFVRRVGTVIVAASVVLWVLLHVPMTSKGQSPVERSVACRIGKALEPVTRPLGFDWRLNLGLVATGLGARELMVGTLGVVFGVEDAGENPEILAEKLRTSGAYSKATAASLLAFFVLACQCTSTVAAVRRETRSWKWSIFLLVYTYAAAYLCALVVHRMFA